MIEFRTSVSGSEAADYKIMRLSDYADAFAGTLVCADSMAGTFTWKDKTGNDKSENLGPHSIKIMRRV